MYNVIIKIVNDNYTNDSSIENMINYIYRTKNCTLKMNFSGFTFAINDERGFLNV